MNSAVDIGFKLAQINKDLHFTMQMFMSKRSKKSSILVKDQ